MNLKTERGFKELPEKRARVFLLYDAIRAAANVRVQSKTKFDQSTRFLAIS